ncbi:MAG: TetR/AcrR family transcriptional regulator [Erysipelotrichaceae bacterium]|nr:TetR/AcrR family transcriptional regulator [Erysipelotrichaceae bacterium]
MEENLKNRILQATINVFSQKGIKFTMDDIAKELSMSKKTIYTVFDKKTSLMLDMVDYCFDAIKVSEGEIIEDGALSTVEKIERILGVMPESYVDLDLAQLSMLRDKYPQVYKRVEHRLETGWESTINLIRQGIDEGVIRDIPIPLVKLMLESTLESFFKRDVLTMSGLTYDEGLKTVVNIIIDGIKVR